jgi:drug/metabolite transporter (DMT)-like permease
MISLLLAIASSSLIFVIFKLFPRFGVDTFQAIVFNYVTALSCGLILYGHEWNPVALTMGNWPLFAVLCGVLFISLFLVMGISSQRNGVALTSTAVKMSMAVSMLIMIFAYNESVGIQKISGILLAFLGVWLVTVSKESAPAEKGAHGMLAVLFIGSGMLDFVLSYVQKFEMGVLTPSLFSAFGFGFAGSIGLIILLFRLYRGKSRFHVKNVLAGIILGIPNYFSIYLLIMSYRDTGWSDSVVLAVVNVSIVVLSAIVGFLIFKEKSDRRKLIGLGISLIAILLLSNT